MTATKIAETVNLVGAVRGSIQIERTARGDHAVTLTRAFDERGLTITGELADLVVLKALLGNYIADCQEAGASDELDPADLPDDEAHSDNDGIRVTSRATGRAYLAWAYGTSHMTARSLPLTPGDAGLALTNERFAEEFQTANF